MRDAVFEAYVEAIERHLTRLRGHEAILAPPDFVLARRWYAAGFSTARVLAGIDATAAELGAVPGSLAVCRRLVERAGSGP